ncbi:hypothetical protein VNO77_01553 [Canavalia gladiata]|uniref:Uncharacterized protein n=1 Tax=Canavalia gladiata TaxID=3824 RepID=A0AAN9MS22_CANGL
MLDSLKGTLKNGYSAQNNDDTVEHGHLVEALQQYKSLVFRLRKEGPNEIEKDVPMDTCLMQKKEPLLMICLMK